MNGLPHYFLIGLITSYVYWLFNYEIAEENRGFMEITGAYLGWLTSKKAQSKEMAFVIFTLLLSLILIMIFKSDKLPSIIGLTTFIAVGWLGSLSTNSEEL
jgi:drug/metabolite transporter superfamily protein YnfA